MGRDRYDDDEEYLPRRRRRTRGHYGDDEDYEDDYRRPRRRKDEGFPVGLIVGIVAGVVGFFMVAGIVFWVVMADLPANNFQPPRGNFPPAAQFFPPVQQPNFQPNIPQNLQPFQPPNIQPNLLPPPPKITGDQNLDQILADLADNMHFTQKNALDKLLKMDPKNPHRPVISQKLAELTRDSNVFIRQSAIRALGVWATEKEIPVIIAALDHEDVFTRREALNTIGKFRDKRAVSAVVRGFQDFHTRSQAKKALREMGSMAEKEVLTLLQSQDVFLRKDAIKILKEIGTMESVPPLQSILTENNIFLTNPAREALQAIASRAKM